MRSKKKFVEITPPPKREPWIEIVGRGRYGYRVTVHKEDNSYFDYGYKKDFRWGYGRAERWGKAVLRRYLARRAHEDYVRMIY